MIRSGITFEVNLTGGCECFFKFALCTNYEDEKPTKPK